MNHDNDIFEIRDGKVFSKKENGFISGCYYYYCEYCGNATEDQNLICDSCCRIIQNKLDSQGQDKSLFPLEINGKVFYRKMFALSETYYKEMIDRLAETLHSANYQSPLNQKNSTELK